MYIPLRTFQRATEFLDRIAGAAEPLSPADLLPGLSGLVGCDLSTYCELGPDAGKLAYIDYPSGVLASISLTGFLAHAGEHPIIAYQFATGDPAPVKISDFLSRQDLHRLGLYADYLRYVSIEHQIAFGLPAPDGQVVGISLCRPRRDFTETDRQVLSALTAPLRRATQRWDDWRRAKASLALVTQGPAGAAGPALLTDREIQVLELAAMGSTNQAIARKMGVSPRTVAKHLQNIYRKLGVSGRAAAVYRTATAGVGEQIAEV